MIHEEICTYEVCKLAKEKGFDGSGCFKHYEQNGLLRSNRSFSRFDLTIDELYKHDTPSEVQVYAPTQSLLQSWLRKKKGIHISVFPNMASSFEFDYIVYNKGDKFWNPIYTAHSDFDTYELALEDALAYSLKNLV